MKLTLDDVFEKPKEALSNGLFSQDFKLSWLGDNNLACFPILSDVLDFISKNYLKVSLIFIN